MKTKSRKSNRKSTNKPPDRTAGVAAAAAAPPSFPSASTNPLGAEDKRRLCGDDPVCEGRRHRDGLDGPNSLVEAANCGFRRGKVGSEVPLNSALVQKPDMECECVETNVVSAEDSQNSTALDPENSGFHVNSSRHPNKKLKMNKESPSSVIGRCNASVFTDPEWLGPCDPGSSVILEGIVWNESCNGLLVVNVTWKGKTYVGTLMDSTNHHWASPSFKKDSFDADALQPREDDAVSIATEGRRLRRCRAAQLRTGATARAATAAYDKMTSVKSKSRIEPLNVPVKLASSEVPGQIPAQVLPIQPCQKKFKYECVLDNHEICACKAAGYNLEQKDSASVTLLNDSSRRCLERCCRMDLCQTSAKLDKVKSCDVEAPSVIADRMVTKAVYTSKFSTNNREHLASLQSVKAQQGKGSTEKLVAHSGRDTTPIEPVVNADSCCIKQNVSGNCKDFAPHGDDVGQNELCSNDDVDEETSKKHCDEGLPDKLQSDTEFNEGSYIDPSMRPKLVFMSKCQGKETDVLSSELNAEGMGTCTKNLPPSISVSPNHHLRTTISSKIPSSSFAVCAELTDHNRLFKLTTETGRECLFKPSPCSGNNGTDRENEASNLTSLCLKAVSSVQGTEESVHMENQHSDRADQHLPVSDNSSFDIRLPDRKDGCSFQSSFDQTKCGFLFPSKSIRNTDAITTFKSVCECKQQKHCYFQSKSKDARCVSSHVTTEFSSAPRQTSAQKSLAKTTVGQVDVLKFQNPANAGKSADDERIKRFVQQKNLSFCGPSFFKTQLGVQATVACSSFVDNNAAIPTASYKNSLCSKKTDDTQVKSFSNINATKNSNEDNKMASNQPLQALTHQQAVTTITSLVNNGNSIQANTFSFCPKMGDTNISWSDQDRSGALAFPTFHHPKTSCQKPPSATCDLVFLPASCPPEPSTPNEVLGQHEDGSWSSISENKDLLDTTSTEKSPVKCCSVSLFSRDNSSLHDHRERVLSSSVHSSSFSKRPRVNSNFNKSLGPK